MKLHAATAILTLAHLSLGGCGSGPTRSSSSPPNLPGSSAAQPMLVWKNTGNSLVPVCPSTTARSNCLSNYTIRNANTGATVTVAITATSYGPVDLASSYEIRVNGFDGKGNPISSPYVALPPAH